MLLVRRQSDDSCCAAGWEKGGQNARWMGEGCTKVGKEVEDEGCRLGESRTTVVPLLVWRESGC